MGDIRLRGGQEDFEGNVEVCTAHGVWSAVHNYHWENADAVVACRQLGYIDHCEVSVIIIIILLMYII